MQLTYFQAVAKTKNARDLDIPGHVLSSRKGKRKAGSLSLKGSESDDEGFEKMDAVKEEDNEAQPDTPDRSEAESTEDDDDDPDMATRSPKTPSNRANKDVEASSFAKIKQYHAPPPPRALPFKKTSNGESGPGSSVASISRPAHTGTHGDDDSSTEDEL